MRIPDVEKISRINLGLVNYVLVVLIMCGLNDGVLLFLCLYLVKFSSGWASMNLGTMSRH